MSDEYMPTTDEVRHYYTHASPAPDGANVMSLWLSPASFDRWLANHDAQVAARALREAANEWSRDEYGPFVDSYLNHRAAAIEGGELTT